MYWLTLPLDYLIGAAAAGLALLAVLYFQHQYAVSSRAAELRRLVLGRLRFALERELPLAPSLNALAQDLLLEIEPRPTRWAFVRLVAVLSGARLRRRATEQLSEALSDLTRRLQEGELRQALQSAPRAFPAPLPAALAEAEALGQLRPVLEQLHDHDQALRQTQDRLRARLVYPTWVLISAMLIVVTVYGQAGGVFRQALLSSTTASTQPLDWMALIYWAVIGASVATIAALWCAAELLGGRGRRAQWLGARLPWFRAYRLAQARARFLGTLARSLQAGHPASRALQGAAPLCPDPAAAGRALTAVSEGRALTAALDVDGLLGPRGGAALPLRRGAEVTALEQATALAHADAHGRREALIGFGFPLSVIVVSLATTCAYWLPILAYQQVFERVLR